MSESAEARRVCGINGCKGHIVVYHSRTALRYRVQYLRCNTCNAKHGSRRAENDLAMRVSELEARLKNLEESLTHR